MCMFNLWLFGLIISQSKQFVRDALCSSARVRAEDVGDQYSLITSQKDYPPFPPSHLPHTHTHHPPINYQGENHETRRIGGAQAKEEPIKFWSRFESLPFNL